MLAKAHRHPAGGTVSISDEEMGGQAHSVCVWSWVGFTKLLSAMSVNLYSHKKQMRIPHSISYQYLVFPTALIFANLLSMKLYVVLICTPDS